MHRVPSILAAVLAATLALAAPGRAGDAATPAAAAGDGASLSADAIYRRVLDNRFNSYHQRLGMRSGDRGGNTQDTVVELKYMNFRHRSDRILSKLIAKYRAPADVRHLGYLVINKAEGVDDQFVYKPSLRRVRRINLRGEAVFGTDFSFEDIIPQEFEDGTYERLPDAVVEDRDCYVIQVTPTPDADSEYSRFVVHVDASTWTPLRTQYWDDKGVRVKELRADASTLHAYEDVEQGEPKQVWIAEKMRMEHLQLESYTELEVLSLEPNPGLGARDFSERELAASH
jgi:hypothetical protein